MSKGCIIDASAIVASLTHEPASGSINTTLASLEWCAIGAPTLFETRMVLVSRGYADKMDQWIAELRPTILPFTFDHYLESSQAFERFGKGRHPAKLNFGDCMAYATAKLARVPLLHVGDDFKLTDLVVIQV